MERFISGYFYFLWGDGFQKSSEKNARSFICNIAFFLLVKKTNGTASQFMCHDTANTTVTQDKVCNFIRDCPPPYLDEVSCGMFVILEMNDTVTTSVKIM